MQDSDSSLITLERSQKLDLLIHLVANLRQSLVISGPSGIGKTRLLDELKARKIGDWPMIAIQASGSLSFESIQKQIFQFLVQHYPEHKNQELSSILKLLDEQNHKVVVIIDDAGKLVPGLISQVIQDAAASKCLRVVFSLTQDELHLKSSSDCLIDQCHFIEIPPLTEKQCATFLQNLSGKPDAVVSFSAINEPLVERLYQRTHGIPGKIISELPHLPKYKKRGGFLWLAIVFFIAIFVAIGVKIFILEDPEIKLEKENGKDALVLSKIEDIGNIPPSFSSYQKTQNTVEPTKQNVMEDVLVPVNTAINDANRVVGDQNSEIKVLKAQIEEVSKKHQANKLVGGIKLVVDEKKNTEIVNTQKNDDRQWILEQPKKNYTIQLMVLSSRESVEAFLKNNENLKGLLKFFRMNKQSQKYVLIYGSFESAVSASKKMESLPIKYRKSWVRAFGVLQKKIKE